MRSRLKENIAMASPYNGLFVPQNTTTGTQPTVTEKDGTPVTGGGKNGTRTTPSVPSVHAPASFTAQPAPKGSVAAGGKY